MAKKPNVVKELKALGKELGVAVNRMKGSKEFKKLEKDVAKGFRSIANSLMASLSAAQKSRSTKNIKRHLGRLVDAGVRQGKIEAQRAQVLAAAEIKKARAKLEKITAKASKS